MVCAHALWVVHKTKTSIFNATESERVFNLVLFILCLGCQMKVLNRLFMCMDTVAVLPHGHTDSPHTHTMESVYAAVF